MPVLPVGINVTVGICVASDPVAVASRNTGAFTVVTVESSAGRVRVVVGAVIAVTLTTIDGDETTVFPVSSVATAKRLNRPAVFALKIKIWPSCGFATVVLTTPLAYSWIEATEPSLSAKI